MTSLPPHGCKSQGAGLFLCAPGVLQGGGADKNHATQISNFPVTQYGQNPQNPTWVLDGTGYWFRQQFPA